MDKLKTILFACFLVSLLTSNSQNVQSRSYAFMLDKLLAHSVEEVSVEDLESEEIVFLDAREKREFEVSKIPNAIWVGYEDFDLTRVDEALKNSKLVVYCSVGYRSEKVAEKLLGAGYSDISNLYGGIFEWVNQGNVVVDEEGEETQKVHGYSRVWGIWLSKGEKVYD